MARKILDTTAGAGDTGKTGGDKINANSAEQYLTKRMTDAAAGLGPALNLATFGDSHLAAYWPGAHAYATYLSDTYINYNPRQVYVENANGQSGDSQVTLRDTSAADRGGMYAVGGTTPYHLRDTQTPQFNLDVAAGRRYDIGVSDGALFNYNGPNTGQAKLDEVAGILDAVIDNFLNGPNQGLYFIIWGTHGLATSDMAAWDNMMQRRSDASGGRIRFVDTAKFMIDATAYNSASPAAAAWTIRGGTPGNFGSVQTDGAHAGLYGNYLAATAGGLAAIYADISGKRPPRGGSYGTQPYDPVNNRWSEILGPDTGLVGTGGIDLTTSGGVFDPNIPGTGHSGNSGGLRNKWGVSYSGVTKPGYGISTTSDNAKQFAFTLNGNASSAGTISFDFYAAGTGVPINNNVTSRRYMAGCEVEFINVTGTGVPRLSIASQSGTAATTPWGEGENAALPDNFSGIFKVRTIDSFTLPTTATSPEFHLTWSFRGKNGITGTILVRKVWFHQVSE